MELQHWLNTTDYIQEFKKEKVSYRKYNDLMIIKRKFGSQYSEDNGFWLNYCRGLIINHKTNQIVFIPPSKSKEVGTYDNFIELGENPTVLIDGTMVNLFYYNEKWMCATRSNIGATNKWSGNLNFNEMFLECSKNLDYDTLNKEYTYSFTMRHKKNRVTSHVEDNELILIEVYHKLQKIDSLPINTGYICLHEWIPGNLIKGMNITVNNSRYKWLSNEHKYIEMIKPNTSNPCLDYLLLRKSGYLTNYLKYFPEKRFEFDTYRNKLHSLTNLIYKYYLNVFIHKQIDKKEIFIV